ncbi:MAG: hypothetical protein HKN42_08995 [Granulosicoccus sp.]|nr:hypothetical protein [Granulosicoccus sp.]
MIPRRNRIRVQWHRWCLVGALFCTTALEAESLDSIDSLSQEQFVLLSRVISAATHYKSIAPAEGLGSLGLDAGIVYSSTEINQAVFDSASSGSFENSELHQPRVHVHKGLPWGLDIGASVSKLHNTDLSVIGGELQYNLIQGGIVSPSLAIRASYSQLQGITDLDLNSSAIELTVSKGFLMLTPYAGIGLVRTRSTPADGSELQAATFNQEKLYAGVTMNLGLAITLEADQTGDFRTYSAKAGIRF